MTILVLLGYGIHVWYSEDSDGRRRSDSRACGQGDVPLREAVDHFGLGLPPDATEVHYDSTSHPLFGTIELRISFRTTSGALARFLAGSGLPKPSSPNPFSVGDDFENPSCVDASPEPHLYSADSRNSHDYQRKVLIGVAVKGGMLVLINAEDIDY